MNDELSHPLSIESWNPTPELQWAKDGPCNYSVSYKLQQKWIETISGKTEWRDVPLEKPAT
jgi:hypothetical protein